MPKVKLVPGPWGSLTPSQPLSAEQVEAKAHDLLQQLTLDEKIHQMSGDTPFTLRADQLAYYDDMQRGWVVEAIGYTVLVGPSSRPSDLSRAHFRID